MSPNAGSMRWKLELEPRVGPSKVGVEKYHAWGGTLEILGVLRGC